MRSWAILGLLVAGALACRSSAAPVAPPAPPTSQVAAPALTSAEIDRALRAEWVKRKIVPSRPVDDERFLRRVSLDIIGRIPTLGEIEAFTREPPLERRARVVARLLASSEYADHWAGYWNDLLLGDNVRGKVIDQPGFVRWLSFEFARNTPWDRLVFQLVTAAGVNRDKGAEEGSEPAPRPWEVPDGGSAPGETMAMADGVPKEMELTAPGISPPTNPAVNWLLKYKDTPQDLAGNVSSLFLGVRIQCAQCHDHKTEKWTQQDFRGLAACFMRTRSFPVEKDPNGGPRRLAVQDVAKTPGKLAKNPDLEPLARALPRALDGTDLSKALNRREALAGWLTSPQNPWFARAIVNRMWGTFLGHGFVEPVDDFRDSNPALMPELLDRLARDLVDHGFDLRHLIRTITATEAYGLASEAASSTSEAGALAGPDAFGARLMWSRFPLKPLGPDELLDSVAVATDLDEMLAAKKDGDLAKAKAQLRKQFNFLFDVDEQSNSATYEGTIPQALMLMNGAPVARVTNTARHGALLKVLSMPEDDARRLESLFLRTLSRKPTVEEANRLLPLVAEPGGKKLERYEDLLWALLNSSEFVFNH